MNRAFVLASNGPATSQPLKYARKDAGDLARCLSAPRCGYQVQTPSEPASAMSVRGDLYGAAEACSPNDTFLCYFSGHASVPDGNLYLHWDEFDPDRPLTTGVPASALTEAMTACRASNKLLILDCCHAGAAAGFKDGGEVRAEEHLWSRNHLVLVASDRLRRAREFEHLGGGFLTQQLCAALSSAFAEAAGDDRRLSIHDAARWLQLRALAHNRQDPERSVPIPYLFGEQLGEFFFTTPPDEWTPTVLEFAERPFVLLPFQWAAETGDPWVVAVGKQLVTNDDYRAFVDAAHGEEPVGEHFVDRRWRGGFHPWRTDGFDEPQMPVVCVSATSAWEYAHWFQRLVWRERSPSDAPEVRVPTPTVWDLAAFGTEHPSRDPRGWLGVSPTVHQSAAHPAPIDTTGARDNRFGVSDMIGNVWEWCDSAELVHQPTVTIWPDRHRVGGPAPAGIRGGGFLDDLSRIAPFVNGWELPDGESTRHSDLGFRLSLRVRLSELPPAIQERVLACDQHASDPPPMEMPVTA